MAEGQVQRGSWRLPTERYRVALGNPTKQAEMCCLSKMCIQDEMTKEAIMGEKMSRQGFDIEI